MTRLDASILFKHTWRQGKGGMQLQHFADRHLRQQIVLLNTHTHMYSKSPPIHSYSLCKFEMLCKQNAGHAS
jgi:hypothetical protein